MVVDAVLLRIVAISLAILFLAIALFTIIPSRDIDPGSGLV